MTTLGTIWSGDAKLLKEAYDSKQWSNSRHAIQAIDVLLSGTMLDYSCVDARLVNR